MRPPTADCRLPTAARAIRARAYVAGDLALIDIQPGQAVEARTMAGADADTCARLGLSYTMLREDAPVACGGLIPLWPGFATAWGLASPLDARLGVAIRAQVRRAIALLERSVGTLRRIEATARDDFPAAQDFLTALGFDPVVKLMAYGPDGGDYWLYQWLPVGSRQSAVGNREEDTSASAREIPSTADLPTADCRERST